MLTGRDRVHILHDVARGIAGGAAGTAAMSLAARWRRVRYARRHGIPVDRVDVLLDYDDSEHVVIAASTLLDAVIGVAPRTPRGRRALFLLVHWGYGSVVGVGHVVAYRAIRREPEAALAFLLGCQTMALTLFPVLGDTPVPWRWAPGLLRTSIEQHAIYAGVVAAVDAITRPAST